MKSRSDLQIFDDLPSDDPVLDFDIMSEVLTSIVTKEDFVAPFNIGIFGEWGLGKSTLMKNIEKLVDSEGECLTVWFNAWAFQDEEHIWAPLCLEILRKIEEDLKDRPKKDMESKIEKLKELLVNKAVIGGVKGAVRIAAAGLKLTAAKPVVEKAEQLVEGLEKQETLMDIFATYVTDTATLRSRFEEVIGDYDRRVIVFIDDIDRISDPEKALDILEGLHLFLSVENTVFILAISLDVLRLGLAKRYPDQQIGIDRDRSENELAKTYLEKIIQIPFRLPKSTHEEFITLVKKHFTTVENIDDISKHFVMNPRWLKRLANHFQVINKLAEKKQNKMGGNLDELRKDLLLKALVLQTRWEEFTLYFNKREMVFWQEEDIKSINPDWMTPVTFLEDFPPLVKPKVEGKDDDDLYEKARDALTYLRYTALSIVPKDDTDSTSKSIREEFSEEGHMFYIDIPSKEITARMIPTKSGFTVLKGSGIAKASESGHQSSMRVAKKHKECLLNGILVKKGDNYELTADVEFNSPSGASEFVYGWASNGRRDWKTEDRKQSFADVEKEILERKKD